MKPRTRPATHLAALLFSVLLAACTTPPAAAPEAPAPSAASPLLLVSLDGFMPDYLGRGLTPNLDALAEEGTRARWMTPSFPTLTFPNHYTVVTGLRPDRHGMVENAMFDPALGQFTLSNRAAVEDGRWWADGEPVWVTAERQGLRTATMFWPGSEAEIHGIRPSHWFPFDSSRSIEDRVSQVLEWLALGEDERPAFLTLYFEHVDSAGHAVGPEGERVDQAIADVDAAMGELITGLRTLGLENRVNLVITSDHGMAATSPDRVVLVEDIVPPGGASLVNVGSALTLDPREGHVEEVESALLGRHERFECWRKGELPQRWAYGRHARIPAIFCQADTGWRFVSRERAARRPGGWEGGFNLGSHGFDPDDPAMRALFIAHGPDIRAGHVIEPFDNIHVQPLLLRLLEIEGPDGVDGDPAVLAPVLRSR